MTRADCATLFLQFVLALISGLFPSVARGSVGPAENITLNKRIVELSVIKERAC